MPIQITQNDSGVQLTEIGESTSDFNGFGEVLFLSSHYPNIHISICPIGDSFTCFIVSKSSSGFRFGTSSPNQKISYKAISVGS